MPSWGRKRKPASVFRQVPASVSGIPASDAGNSTVEMLRSGLGTWFEPEPLQTEPEFSFRFMGCARTESLVQGSAKGWFYPNSFLFRKEPLWVNQTWTWLNRTEVQFGVQALTQTKLNQTSATLLYRVVAPNIRWNRESWFVIIISAISWSGPSEPGVDPNILTSNAFLWKVKGSHLQSSEQQLTPLHYS
jgi:hypothetical protein